MLQPQKQQGSKGGKIQPPLTDVLLNMRVHYSSFLLHALLAVFFWRDTRNAKWKDPIWGELVVPSHSHADLPVPTGPVPEGRHPGSLLWGPAEPHCWQGTGEHSEDDCLTYRFCVALKYYSMLYLIQGSSAMTQILTQKLGALPHLSPLLKSPNPSLQKTAMSLLGNMSRSSSVQSSMGKEKYEELC